MLKDCGVPLMKNAQRKQVISSWLKSPLAKGREIRNIFTPAAFHQS
jgi:hypothetical protein